jgi:hypothetical protein
MYRGRMRKAVVVAIAVLATACSNGGSVRGTKSVNAAVQVSWAANREAAVNAAGGGYRVYYGKTPGFDIATASFVDVPYVSGPTAPTTTNLTLSSGDNFVKVVAYSALNSTGSQPSTEIFVSVPFSSTVKARRE